MPWHYCELTAIEATHTDKQWRVDMTLWSADNSLRLECNRIIFNGGEIVP